MRDEGEALDMARIKPLLLISSHDKRPVSCQKQPESSRWLRGGWARCGRRSARFTAWVPEHSSDARRPGRQPDAEENGAERRLPREPGPRIGRWEYACLPAWPLTARRVGTLWILLDALLSLVKKTRY